MRSVAQKMAASSQLWLLLAFLCASDLLQYLISAKEATKEETQPPLLQKKKKNILQYNDEDMEQLLKQWEKDDVLEEWELPQQRKPLDTSQAAPGKPDSVLKMTKKGKTLIMFATVSGNPTKKETQEIGGLWQWSLFNANYNLQRVTVGTDVVIFMLPDGSKAWEIKEFLVNQDRCADVTLQGRVYPGKGGSKNQTKASVKKKEADEKTRSFKEVSRGIRRRDDL